MNVRSKFSEGQFVKIALADVAMATMGHLGYIAEAQLADEGRKAIGNHIFGTFGHDFTLKDGCRVMIVGISQKQWNAIVTVTQTENEILSLEEELDLDFSNEDFELVLRTNLISCFSLSREAIRLMKNNGGGRIINTVSMLGPQARPTVPAYISAKEGLRALTRALAVEVGADGILVNAIAPGYIATELNTALLEDQEFSEWVISKTPLARWGQPHELGGGAVFLMSEAGSFVNGQVLSIDGGMSIQV